MESALTELNQFMSGLSESEEGNDVFSALGTYHIFRTNRKFVPNDLMYDAPVDTVDEKQTKIDDYFPRVLTMDDAWNLLGLASQVNTLSTEAAAPSDVNANVPSSEVVSDLALAQVVEVNSTPVSDLETIVSSYFMEEGMVELETSPTICISESKPSSEQCAVSTSKLHPDTEQQHAGELGI